MVKTKKGNGSFRLNAKIMFLTYPCQSGLTKEVILQELKKKIFDIHSVVMSKERGESGDGYDHFHVLLETKTKKNYKDPRCFDILGVHGKYESTRNKKRAMKYICKEGNVLCEGIELGSALLSTFKKPFDRFMFRCRYLGENPSELISRSRNSSSYVQDDFEIYNDYLISPKKYKQYILESVKVSSSPPKRLWIHKLKMDELMIWAKTIVSNDHISKSLYIHGAPGVGKTNMARLMFDDKMFIVKHVDKLKEADVESSVAIGFDDVNLNTDKYTREDCINIVDPEIGSQINVKNSMISLEPYVPKVFISNFLPERVYKGYDEAVERRLKVICLESAEGLVQAIYKREKDVPLESKSDYVEMHESTFKYLVDWVQGKRGL
uniref:Replicase n=1 Tax=Pyropia pulchra TaxID=60925 RepID=Q9M7P9_9RHOD|nr:replicase [Pyropia pulchra]